MTDWNASEYARISTSLDVGDSASPETRRLDFATDVLDRYKKSARDAPGEENYFRLYQLDITLAPR